MKNEKFNTICVLGAGIQGTPISLNYAVHGYKVNVVDVSDQILKKTEQNQKTLLENNEKANEILNRLSYTTDINEGVSNVDLVVEMIPENLEIKRKIFAKLDKICSPKTILGTNSSSLRVSLIEDVTNRRDKVLNMHYFGPIVELMKGSQTSDETIEKVYNFINSVKLMPAVVQKESTGFILNRIWRVFKKEALHIVDEGIATFEEVDMASVKSGERQFGFFTAMDGIGLDTVLNIERTYYKSSGKVEDKPPKYLEDMVEKSLLGVKTGKGFYSYPNPSFMEPNWLDKCKLSQEEINYITDRIDQAVIKECHIVVDSGIISPDDIEKFYKMSLDPQARTLKKLGKIFYNRLKNVT